MFTYLTSVCVTTYTQNKPLSCRSTSDTSTTKVQPGITSITLDHFIQGHWQYTGMTMLVSLLRMTLSDVVGNRDEFLLKTMFEVTSHLGLVEC